MSADSPRPEVLALLADSKEHPDEDGLRLILADWLEENGTPLDRARAEMIRCQVEHARLPAAEPARNEFGRRARRLLQRHGRDWLGPLEPWSGNWACPRGLFAIPLPVSSLRSQALTALAGSEPWAWVEEVHIAQAGDDDVARLAGCPLLEGPTSLGFARSQLGPAGLQALGRMRWLGRIIRLDLGQQPITSRGLSALLQSPHLGRLRHLDLAAAGLDADTAAHLAGASCADQVRSLSLWGNRLGDQGTTDLVLPSSFVRLEMLDLRSNGIGNRGALALAECPALARLRTLNLADNRVGSDGGAALATSPHLARLEALFLWGNPVGAETAWRLEERFGARVFVSPVGA